MRDVHIALRELQAREAYLFELVEASARLELDELAEEVRAGEERDPLTQELVRELLPGDRRIKPHDGDRGRAGSHVPAAQARA